MIAHIPESTSAWLVGANIMPPWDPNDDDEEGEDENGDESDDEGPAVIREPDDE
jgi:hypothetical protein